jgi:hypothetical protein
LELLEERNDALIVLDNKTVRVLDKNQYNLLKYKCYHGKKIRFVVVANGHDKLSLEEGDQDGVFLCTFSGITVTIADSPVETASAIFEAQCRGNLGPIIGLWKLKHVEKFLGIIVALKSNSEVELTREGKLLLPNFVNLEILEWMERSDGGRVVKVELSRGAKSPVDRIFTHEIESKGQTRVMVNETAVALIGRDETGQCWIHAVPLEYRSRSIDSCEMWLCGGECGKDELIDVLT